jgi:hypothetical protein
MVPAGDCGRWPQWRRVDHASCHHDCCGGSEPGRLFRDAFPGLFQPAPPAIQVQLESTPPGADAKTSLGPSCKTPCSVSVPAPDAGFSVTYTLNRFQPATIPVQIIRNPDDSSTITDPNPVFAELQPAGPPPRVSGKPMHKPKKPEPLNGTASAGSPFPDPGAAPPGGSSSTR